jgi:hypothetical protein
MCGKGVLTSGEIVQVKLKGAFKEGLVCTESRVIILKGGFMAGQMLGTTCFQQSYSNISGVQVKFHFGTGYLELNSRGMQNTPKSYWSTDKSGDPAKAPNCISLNNKNQKEKFQRACTCYRRDYLRTTVGAPARIFGDDFSLGD